MKGTILVVDDHDSIRHFLSETLEADGHTVTAAANAAEALQAFAERDPDIVLLDINLGEDSGFDVLEQIRALRADATVVMITGNAEIRSAVDAMRLGAVDYLPKPVDFDHLLLVIDRILHQQKKSQVLDRMQQSRRKEFGIDFVTGENSKMQQVIDLLRQVSVSDTTTVLIEGESGTGKELIAHILHQLGNRAEGPLLDINCAALPEELLESELFGHEKGAYTDAHQQKKGLLELADNGTLFLDEVGEMSLAMQVKLLRVLEKRQFRRVGGVKDISVDVRIVSATNRNLAKEVQAGRFREDLFYRLKVVPIVLPPLRERGDDITLLATHFLEQFNQQFRKSFHGFTDGALRALHEYSWPGNIRELRNLIERTVLLNKGERVDQAMLGLEEDAVGGSDPGMQAMMNVLDGKIPADGFPLEETLNLIEKEIICQVNERVQGNQTRAARILHMNRDKLRYRMKQYGIDRESPVS